MTSTKHQHQSTDQSVNYSCPVIKPASIDCSDRCTNCKLYFNTVDQLELHFNRIHHEHRPYVCCFCSVGFALVGDLKQHISVHFNECRFTCSVCLAVSFTTLSELMLHTATVHNVSVDVPAGCAICSRCGDIVLASRLGDHTRRHHVVECKQCGKVVRERGLYVHMRKHTLATPFDCSLCSSSFRTRFRLHEHEQLEHQDELSFCCTFCSKKFPNERRLKDHERVHMSGISCEICGRPFRLLSSLRQHVRIHKQPSQNSQLCTICGGTFVDLPRHMQTHEVGRLFTCDFCQKVFRHLPSLSLHRKTKHLSIDSGQEHVFICPCCGRKYTRLYRLRNHMISHTGDGEFTCAECGQIFVKSSELKKHLSEHEPGGKASLQCGECGLELQDIKSFGDHSLLHRAGRTLSEPRCALYCSRCGKAFFVQSNLQRHALVCSGEAAVKMNSPANKIVQPRCFLCPDCPSSYTCFSNLCLHSSEVHGKKAKNVWPRSFALDALIAAMEKKCREPDNTYVCHQCSTVCVNAQEFRDHVMAEHPPEDKAPDLAGYQCEVCGKTFSQLRNWKRHTYTHTGVKRFCCAYCGRRFTQSGTMKLHILKQHTNNINVDTEPLSPWQQTQIND